MAVAQTGATSGANILTDGTSGFETRKRSIQHFSSGIADNTDSVSGTGYLNEPTLNRDPSVQLNLNNLYIDSKADLHAPS